MAISIKGEDILLGFKKIGIAKNDKLIVHSSLSSFGQVVNGAKTVVLSLQRAVGTGGLIMMPTFTYGHEPFDVHLTPSKAGRITEVFRLSSSVFRSEHPGFSVAVWGANASEFAKGHDSDVGIGRETPIHRMIESGAKILLLGVDQTSNSSLHLAQDLAQAPYLNRYRMTEVIEADGSRRPFRMRRAGCSLGFEKIQPIIDRSGIENRVMIGSALVRILPGIQFIDLSVALLREDPGFLLCDRQECSSCAEAREMIRAIKTKKKSN